MNHKSGFVAILGLPNSGKSTLLNALLGQKLSIINNKPQTTRKKIQGILNSDNYQVIFLDTPGILEPSYLLQEKMMMEIEESLEAIDLVLLVIDVKNDPAGKKLVEHEFVKNVLSSERKILTVLNKIDLVPKDEIENQARTLKSFNGIESIVGISASLNFNIELLKDSIVELLPDGPKYFPGDQITELNERFFVSELIREKILDLYREEIPYSCEVIIREFKEREKGKDYVSAEIIIEKESQKPIIIGKNGSAIKKLGEAARESIEEFLERKVFLELHVKVNPKWRSDERFLKILGYKSSSKQES
jgi:GTPase